MCKMKPKPSGFELGIKKSMTYDNNDTKDIQDEHKWWKP